MNRKAGEAMRRLAAVAASALIAFTLLSGFHHHCLDLVRSADSGGGDCAVCQASRNAGLLLDQSPLIRPLPTDGEATVSAPIALLSRERASAPARAPPGGVSASES